MRWNFKSIYNSYKDERYKNDLYKLETNIEKLIKLENTSIIEINHNLIKYIENYISIRILIEELFNKIGSYNSLKISEDITYNQVEKKGYQFIFSINRRYDSII